MRTLSIIEEMKKIWIFFSAFVLTACTADDLALSLEEYFQNSNYVQEQNNSSEKELVYDKKERSAWADVAFSERCEWFDLERVVDGDTIIVHDDQTRIRVRMIGIDTPESKKEGTAIEDYALEASAFLKALLVDTDEVCLVEDEVGDKYDTYGRKLSYVFTTEGADLNADMVKSGLAEAYTRFPMERGKEFEALEVLAQKSEMGKWK